jgi:hypothetical protein
MVRVDSNQGRLLQCRAFQLFERRSAARRTVSRRQSLQAFAIAGGQYQCPDPRIFEHSRSRRTRAPIQKLADQVSAWFVPAVIVVAVVAFVIWAVFGWNHVLGFSGSRPPLVRTLYGCYNGEEVFARR